MSTLLLPLAASINTASVIENRNRVELHMSYNEIEEYQLRITDPSFNMFLLHNFEFEKPLMYIVDDLSFISNFNILTEEDKIFRIEKTSIKNFFENKITKYVFIAKAKMFKIFLKSSLSYCLYKEKIVCFKILDHWFLYYVLFKNRYEIIIKQNYVVFCRKSKKRSLSF